MANQSEKSKKSRGIPAVPEIVYAEASPRSQGGVSMFDVEEQITAETVANFVSSNWI